MSLGPSHDLPVECVASFDNLQPVQRSMLTVRLGSLGEDRHEIGRALAAMSDC